MLRKLRLQEKVVFLLKNTCNYMEQNCTKNRAALVKTNRVSKSMLSMQKLCCSQHKYKGSSKEYYPFVILVMPSENESINLKLPKY